MADLTQDASLAAKQAQDSELVALKQQMDRLKGDLTPGKTGLQKLRKACTDFEAVFISKMWEQMRATIPKGGMLHSPQEDMYRSMFDRDFAEKLAGDGGVGMGDMLYNQLKDKLKGVSKTTAKTGSALLESSTEPAASAVGATVSGALEKPSLKAPKRPMGSTQQTGQAASSAAPEQPSSVSGDVMADVENLARRIEADYDLRQAQAAVQSGQVSGYGQRNRPPDAGRILATVG